MTHTRRTHKMGASPRASHSAAMLKIHFRNDPFRAQRGNGSLIRKTAGCEAERSARAPEPTGAKRRPAKRPENAATLNCRRLRDERDCCDHRRIMETAWDQEAGRLLHKKMVLRVRQLLLKDKSASQGCAPCRLNNAQTTHKTNRNGKTE